MAAIDNDKDLSEYVSAHFKQLPPRRGEPKYERNPVSISLEKDCVPAI